MKRLLLAGAAAFVLLPAVANAASAPIRTIGHDGNWTIGIWHQGFCSMTATSTDGTRSIAIAFYNPGDHDNMVSASLIDSHIGPQTPDKLLVTITDQNGQLIANKQFVKNAGDGSVGTVLSTSDMITLFGLGLGGAFSDRQIVHIDAGEPGLAFDVDITGAMQAYQNTRACAGVGDE